MFYLYILDNVPPFYLGCWGPGCDQEQFQRCGFSHQEWEFEQAEG